MTDVTAAPIAADRERPRSNTRRRFLTERIFKGLGLAAVLAAGAMLVLLMSTIVGQGIPAFTYNYVSLPMDLSEVDADDPRSANARGIANDALSEAFPTVKGRTDRRALRGILSASYDVTLAKKLIENPQWAGSTRDVRLGVSDTADLWLKGLYGSLETKEVEATAAISVDGDDVTVRANGPVFAADLEAARALVQTALDRVDVRIAGQERAKESYMGTIAENEAALADADEESRALYEARIETARERLAATETELSNLGKERTELAETVASGATLRLRRAAPSLLVNVAGGVVKATEVSADTITGEAVTPMDEGVTTVAAGEWSLSRIDRPEAGRKISDKEIVWLETLRSQGRIESGFNTTFFTAGASREPEEAGIWGAIVGSFLTMVVTLILSFPIGVAAAIYLEEFAPKSRFIHFIEVNINNLAAVPSIVFGLLGAALIVNGVNLGYLTIGGFGPRSAAVTGGIVLALMTLPTIIIATRAALKSVPPSIREAALGVGASRIQAVFHHVLPLAMPGILTGTIIGMAQALGETAPLLMIGMVAFIKDIPAGFADSATVLPVQIYMWADFPEIGFQQKTAAAILILLAFLVAMNALAVFLRRKFERRW